MGSTCPSEHQLERLLAEDDDSAELESLSRHLDVCSACRVRLDELARRSWEAVGKDLHENVALEAGGGEGRVLREAMEGLMGRESLKEDRSRATDISGTIFGEFEILDEIAQGGMGVVYRARQRSLNRLVALKLLGSGTIVSPDRVARFQTETEAVASIAHPNIVPIYGVGEVEGQPYFSMKLIEGGSLAQRLEELTPVGVATSSISSRSDLQSRQQRIVAIMVSLCRAIQYTHERGILHRDLKPNNVLMDEHGEPQITDFGLAKILEKDSGLTDSFAVMGTPSYMAPEQATGNAREITTAADIYGLGAILYELLCGAPPFKEATPIATMRRVIDSDPESPRKICPLIDSDLETVCLKALDKEPARRYESAHQMAEDLQRWQAGEAVMARPIGVVEKVWRTGRRNPIASALVGMVCVLLVVLVLGSLAFGVRVAELYRESEKLVTGFRLDEAEEQLARGDSLTGVALLGRILEDDPMNRVAATRLVSALLHRDFAFPKIMPVDHGSPIQDLKLSPGQEHLASIGIDGSAYLWKLGSDEARLLPLVSEYRVRSLAFDTLGERLFGGCVSGDILVWDVRTGKLLETRRGHGLDVNSLDCGGSENLLISGSQDRTARVWTDETGDESSIGLRHPGPLVSVRASRAGDLVLTACRDGAARVWETESGEMVGGPFYHIGPIRGVQFDPLERRVITYGMGPKAVVWDVKENRPATMNIEHKAPITEARFNPDGRTFVTVGEDGIARIWDAVSGKFLREFSSKKTRIEAVRFGPLGRRMLIVASGGTCQLWDADGENMLVNEMKHPARVTAAIFAKDGRSIITGCDDGRIRMWQIGRHPHWEALVRHHGPVNDAVFSEDGKSLVTAGQDRVVRISDPATGLDRVRPLRQRNPVQFVSLARSGAILAGERTPTRRAVAALWDALTGEMLTEPIRRVGNLLCGEFSPDGSLIVLGAEQGEVSVWPINNDLDPLLNYHHRGPVTSVQFDHSGTRIVSTGSDGVAHVSAVPGGSFPETTIQHGERLLAADIDPTDKWLITASSDHTARFWSFRENGLEAVGEPLQHEDVVNWVEFDESGEVALTASADGTVGLWDVASQTAQGVPLQHPGPIVRAHFNRAGNQIVVLGGDGVARIWDRDSRRPLTEPFQHSREIYGGSFSPDGTLLVTHSADDVARVWSVPSPPLPFPVWFSKFLSSLTGVTIDSKGNREGVDEERMGEIRREIAQLEPSGYYEKLARWLVDFSDTRNLSPFRKKTLTAYVEDEIEFDSFTSINQALKFAPVNGQALARHARLLIRDIGRGNTLLRDASFYSRLAVELSPQSPEVWKVRAEVMRATGRIEAEWEAMDRFLMLSEGPTLE